MVNSRIEKIRRIWLSCFLALYISFLILDIFTPNSVLVSILKVGSIFLCFIYALIYSGKDKLLVLAMLITFVADIILAINNIAFSGVVVFCTAQTTHFIRLSQKKLRNIIFYSFIVLALLIFNLLMHPNTMHVAGGIYALLLLSNLFMSFVWMKTEHSNFSRYAFFGFLLFLACDLCVATSYLSLTGILPGFLYSIANFMSWVFYLPSQILISNSPRCVLQ